MLFYRKDILEKLKLTPPQTWEEFYHVISILQQNNLQAGILETNALNAGISSGISIFEKFLIQNGGTYYNDQLTKTAFDTKTAYDAFTQWVELYTEYGLDRSFDFYNRFRTGEMPVGIQPYTMYNQLYVAAPEIRGLWGFTLVPGTEKQDGSIDRAETAGGTAAIMLSDAKDPEAAYQFIDWWTSAEIQTRFGNELEAILGVAARYDTANKEAFANLAWSDAESETLIQQWEKVTDVPQIPGNYFIARCLTNAFRTVVDEDRNPVRTLNTYNKDMNSEIIRKRKEFKLD
jgi:ABC-type glycerol-3-phosphate transport system substrate-binding protein